MELFLNLDGIKFPHGVNLATFDYDNMFTNIPFHEAKKVIEMNYHLIENVTSVPNEVFIRALSFFIEDNAYFSYNGVYYRQCKGLTMGNNLSQIIAEIFTNYALQIAFESAPNSKIFFLRKFVDDIFTCADIGYIEKFKSDVSKFSGGINLKCERENEDNEVRYLDVIIKRDEGLENELSLRWYQKPISNCQVLNFHSAHPFHIKENLINEYVRSALGVTSALNYDVTIKLVYKTLRNSDYPKRMIRKSLTRAKMTLGSVSVTSTVGVTDINALDEYATHYCWDQSRSGIRFDKTKVKKDHCSFVSIPNFKPFKKHLNKISKKLNLQRIKLITKISKTNKNKIYANMKDKKLFSHYKNACFDVRCLNCGFIYNAKTYFLDVERTIRHLMYNKNSPVRKHIVQFRHIIDPVPKNVTIFTKN